MPRVLGVAGIVVLTAWVGFGEGNPHARLTEADVAWDRGDYPRALTEYLALLDGSPADDVFEAIALQTGELFKTTELTTDGGAPRFSPDGRYLTYEVGRGVTRKTRLAAADTPTTTIAELAGYGASFSPDGSQIAYLKQTATLELQQLEKSAEQADGTERTRITAELTAAGEIAARITIRDVSGGAEREVDTGDRRKSALRLAADGAVVFTGSEGTGVEQIFVIQAGRPPAAVTSGAERSAPFGGTGTSTRDWSSASRTSRPSAEGDSPSRGQLLTAPVRML